MMFLSGLFLGRYMYVKTRGMVVYSTDVSTCSGIRSSWGVIMNTRSWASLIICGG